MSNPFTDKYFTKSRYVAKYANLNPVVKYRVFTRFDGIAALKPMRYFVEQAALGPVDVQVLPDGTPFKSGDTIAVIEGKFQDIVELETTWLNLTALPCYCANEANKIVKVAKDKILIDFAARHLFSPMSIALASYGAQVGGIPACSTDVGANALRWLEKELDTYEEFIHAAARSHIKNSYFPKPGMGTTPHALIAIFKGNYLEMAKAYRGAYPQDNFVALIDYNNLEVSDSLLLLKEFNKHLAGVRIDTCGENYAQVGFNQDGSPKYADERGVSVGAVRALKNALVSNGGEHVKVFVSSGFNSEKTLDFVSKCPSSFDGIGTGSFIPKVSTATADIFEVNSKLESKIGREWGIEKNKEFFERVKS